MVPAFDAVTGRDYMVSQNMINVITKHASRVTILKENLPHQAQPKQFHYNGTPQKNFHWPLHEVGLFHS